MGMTTPTTWSDVPPSCVGRFWFRNRDTKREVIGYRFCLDSWEIEGYGQNTAGVVHRYQIGPRVLTAEKTVQQAAEVERLLAENAELRALIENNNAVAGMCGLNLPKSL